MTYKEFREYGYISKLSCLRCGSGPTGQQVGLENSISQQQLSLGEQEQQQSQEQYQQMQLLEAPYIAQQSALATGSPSAALAATMPQISKISGGFNAAQEQIGDTVAPGAARDTALANLQTQKATAIGDTQASAVAAAPQNLANVGAGLGAFSLQQLGAALSGYGGASTANTSAANMQVQQSAAKWAPALSLASTAGGLAGSIWEGKG